MQNNINGWVLVNPESVPDKIIDKVFDNLADRRGFDDFWDSLDLDTRAEIEDELREVIHDILLYNNG